MIAATKVPDDDRLDAMPAVFGRRCVQLEGAIFDMAAELIREYQGGYWEFFKLDNGGFYMAPRLKSDRVLVTVMNGFADHMSPDAAGIVCCLMTYSHQSFSAPDGFRDVLAEQFHLLRDFATDHAEARAIFAAID